jgi:hypothetical protein
LRTWVRATAGSAALAVTVAGCGGANDSADPAAVTCRAALQARVDAGFPAIQSADDPVAANALIANSLAGPKPEACAGISDQLGVKLLNELAGAAAARYRAGVAGRASTSPSGTPEATPVASATGEAAAPADDPS